MKLKKETVDALFKSMTPDIGGAHLILAIVILISIIISYIVDSILEYGKVWSDIIECISKCMFFY